MLSERQLVIFKAIVDEFIRTAEPVGSKTLMSTYNLPYSSATIRNDMAELENVGYLEKTHTSSGRVPSAAGYRYYVENLMEKKVNEVEKAALQSVLDTNLEIDEVIKRCSDILSQMTNLTALVLGPDSHLQCLQHIKLFPIDEKSAVAVFITDKGHTENRLFQFDEVISIEDLKSCCDILNDRLIGTPIASVVEKLNELEPVLAEHVKRYEALFQAFLKAFVKFNTDSDNVYFSGKSNMLYQPEFNDIEKVRKLMSVMENDSVWRRFEHQKKGINVSIGESGDYIDVDDVSVVSSRFRVGNDEGQLMVVGPTRMAYDRVIGMMEYMTETIEKMFNDSNKENCDE